MSDNAAVQRAINVYAHRYAIPFMPLDIDGDAGPLTRDAVVLVKRCLGYKAPYDTPTIDAAFVRRLARPLGNASAVQRARGLAYRRRIRRAAARDGLAERAWQVAVHMLGTTEKGGNNRGPEVERIIKANQGDVGEPWCGDFVAFCYRLAGSKAVTRSWASVDALGRVAGLKTVDRPIRGDIVRYTFSHTGLFGSYADKDTILAIEGNTGARGAVSDSKDGHDGVYEKRRSTSLVNNYRRVLR